MSDEQQIGQGFTEHALYEHREYIKNLIQNYYNARSNELDPPEGEGVKMNEQLKGIKLSCEDLYNVITGDENQIELEVKNAVSISNNPF